VETKYHRDSTMTENQVGEKWTLQQILALASLFIISVWSIVVLWIHLFTLASGDYLEIAFIGTVALVSLLLLPLYWKRVKWSYIGGILLTTFSFICAIVIASHRVIFFSPSLYNIFVIVAYLTTFVCLLFSILSFRQLKSGSRRTTTIGISGTILIFALIAGLLVSNQSFIRQFTVKSTLNRTYDQLERVDGLENKIEYLRHVGNIPSLTVGIVVNDSLAWVKGFGEQEEPDTVYNIGSSLSQ